MNLLLITEIDPFPPNRGEKLRSYGLLKLVSDLNLNVFAIAGNAPSDDVTSAKFPGIKFFPWEFSRYKSCGRLAKYFRLFTCDKKLLGLIGKIMDENSIDVAYIDYLFYGQYIPFFRKKGIPVIYGTHNSQAKLIYQRPSVSFRNSLSNLLDYIVNRLHEVYFFRKADALIVVSESDKKYHQVLYKKEKIYLIPNFLIEDEYNCELPEKENYILMTANFVAFQNSFGLTWFVREIWDKDLWNKTKLLLVGLGSKELYRELAGKFVMENIEAIGEVDDLKPYICSALVSIVPLLHGSGSRLKCLESMALKTQLLSTSKGAEGIDHNNSIIIADTPAEFKKELIRILDSKSDLSDKAYNAFMDTYSLKPNLKIFKTILQNISKIS
jgi:hypothetical protein